MFNCNHSEPLRLAAIRVRITAIRGFFFLAILTLIFFTATEQTFAADAQPVLKMRIGLAETYKVGCWVEVQVEARSLQEATTCVAEVDVIDADGNIVQYRSEEVAVDSSGKFLTAVPVRINRVNTRFTARLLFKFEDRYVVWSEQKVPVEQTTELTQFEPLYVAVGKVDGISITEEFVDQLHVQKLHSLAELPKNPLCWQGIDTLIYDGAMLSGFTSQTKENQVAQLDRLRKWVQTGGHLVLFPGANPEQFIESAFVKSLPMKFEGTAQVRDFSRLESFVGEPSRIRNRTALSIPHLTEFDGKVIVDGLSGPLIVRSAWGFGRVTFVSVDLNNKAFQQWDALPQLYRLLANLPEIEEKKTSKNSNQLTQAGLTDFKTQWDAALSDFQLQSPSVWLPLTYLLLAALLVGPIDYFIVKHFLKRPWMTWITFPLLIISLVVWGALGSNPQSSTVAKSDESQEINSANRLTNNSTEVLGNQCLVLDYAADTNTERHFGYVKILCNQTARYDVESKVEVPIENATSAGLFSPGAVPEQSFRGYYRESGMHLDQTAYQVLPEQLKSFSTPIYESSTALFEITGANTISAEASSSVHPVVEHQLHSSNTNHLKGTLTHHLDVPITDWLLAYGKIIYFVPKDHPLAELTPGKRLKLPSQSISQKEFSTFLTGTRTESVSRGKGHVGQDFVTRRESYNPFSTELTPILQTLAFYDSIGGKEYSSLTNVELTTWDFTPMLQLNRAVLIGRLKKTTMHTKVNGQPVSMLKNNGYIRLLIPVKQNKDEIDRLPDYNKQKEIEALKLRQSKEKENTD